MVCTRTTTRAALRLIDDSPPLAETAVLVAALFTMFGSTVAVPLILSGPLGMTDPVDIGKLYRYHVFL